MDSYKHFTLRFWLVFLFSVSTFLIVLSCGAGIYLVVKQVMTDDILDINRAYSEKMAQTTDLMFQSMKKNLETSAGEIAPLLKDRQRLQQHLKLWQESTLFFNSILVANSKGKILATEPRMEVDGRFLMSSGAREALEKKKTVVSQPYKAITGRLIFWYPRLCGTRTEIMPVFWAERSTWSRTTRCMSSSASIFTKTAHTCTLSTRMARLSTTRRRKESVKW
ncbi:hypothetical protein BBO01nite_06910 [Brevibacillus borstelensis]|nr:hypothetical protein BBO01nite_06910 [Brevibacillus borstelensis]